MRDLDAFALRSFQSGWRDVVEGVLDWPQHQRQGRAKLVADVREERRLGPVDLRQRLGATPLLLIGQRIRDACADLAGRQFEKATIIGVKQPKRVQARDQHPPARGFAPGGDWNECGLSGSLVPKAFWKLGSETGCKLRKQLRFLIANDAGDRPERRRIHRLQGLESGAMRTEAGRAGERDGLTVGLGEKNQRERQVLGVRRERLRRPTARSVQRSNLACRNRKLAQQSELPLADDAPGVVGIGADDSARGALVVGNRAIRESVIGLLPISAALHDQELLLDVDPLVALHGGREHRRDLVPDFAPHFLGRPAERPRMLAADDRLVGIVIKVSQFISPADPDRLTGREHDPHRGLQTARPGLRFTQRRARPVVGTQPRAQFSAAGEKVRGRQNLTPEVGDIVHAMIRRDVCANCFMLVVPHTMFCTSR